MKRLFFILISVLFGFGLQNSEAQESVVINGVAWATCNVGASSPEGYGDFYTLQEAQTACAKGWRVPTKEEINSLLNKKKVISKWTTLNGINGRRFTDKKTKNSIFFSAVGYSSGSNYAYAGERGFYWSSSKSESNRVYYLHFNSSLAVLYDAEKTVGISVRCVAE